MYKKSFLFLSAFVFIGLSGCVDTSSEPKVSCLDPRETNACAQDELKYAGLDCFGVPMGISLSYFSDKCSGKYALVEQGTKFPNILKKYALEAIAPQEISWKPLAHFVVDENAFRLYTIDGFSDESMSGLVQYFRKKFGIPKKDGLAFVWSRGGTKLRVIDGDRPLISFTHDKLIELSSEKMADAMDRGDYVH